MRKSTLIILSPGFPENEKDSSCLPLQQWFVEQIRDDYPGISIHILSFQYPYFEKKYTWKGISVTSFNGKNKGGLSRLLLRRRIYRELESLHRNEAVLALISFWYGECALVGNRFAARYGLPHRCWVLGQDAGRENKYPLKQRPVAAELAALSEFLQEEFEKNHGIKPGHVVLPGIRPQAFHNVNKKNIDLLGVGSLIPLKRFDIFIELVAEIKKIFPEITAMLVGEGPERKKLEALVRYHGLEDIVIFKGQVSHTEVIQLMQSSRVLVHPSSYEGFSGVCMEALAAGAQVISFQKPMHRSYDNWHIATSREELLRETVKIISDYTTPAQPVIIQTIGQTAQQFMELCLDNSDSLRK